MNNLELRPITLDLLPQVTELRDAFPKHAMTATPDPDRIPGLDRLEEYEDPEDWIRDCEKDKNKITWFLAVRKSDNKPVGALCFRHDLAYDDDDPDFASHIGYSVRPDERRKGYATEMLRLAFEKAREQGLATVRLICRTDNTASGRAIQRNGGILIDTLTGEESRLTVSRYDVPTGKETEKP